MKGQSDANNENLNQKIGERMRNYSKKGGIASLYDLV